MLFSNRIKYFICSFITSLGFGLNLSTLNAMDHMSVEEDYMEVEEENKSTEFSYIVARKRDWPEMIIGWSGVCFNCYKNLKVDVCFIPLGVHVNLLNQICRECLEKKYLIPHLEHLKQTSNNRDDYVQKASTSIIEGSSKYMDQDPEHGRPLCDHCKKWIILIKDDVIIISRNAHIHKRCLESIFGTNIDNIMKNSIYGSNLKFANPPVVNIKALVNRVWPQ